MNKFFSFFAASNRYKHLIGGFIVAALAGSFYAAIRRPTGSSSSERRMSCPTSNGCPPHRRTPEPTTWSSGTPSDPSTTPSGTSTDQATGGTASAPSHPPTSLPQPSPRPTRTATRSPDSTPTPAPARPRSRSRIRTSPSPAPHAASTSRDSRTGCVASSPIGQRTATTARTSMGAYLARKKWQSSEKHNKKRLRISKLLKLHLIRSMG